MKNNELTYDEAIKKAETIIDRLESSEAISMDEYKRLAHEANELLMQCKSGINKLENQLLP